MNTTTNRDYVSAKHYLLSTFLFWFLTASLRKVAEVIKGTDKRFPKRIKESIEVGGLQLNSSLEDLNGFNTSSSPKLNGSSFQGAYATAGGLG